MNNKKHVFIDMDGVLADYWCKEGKASGIIDYYRGFFLNKEPVREVIASILKNFGNDNLYILSASPHQQGIDEKNEWLDEHFKFVEEKNRYFIQYPNADKCDSLKEIMKNLNLKSDEVIIIDDHHDILKKCEQELSIQVYHPIHIIVMNY